MTPKKAKPANQKRAPPKKGAAKRAGGAARSKAGKTTPRKPAAKGKGRATPRAKKIPMPSTPLDNAAMIDKVIDVIESLQTTVQHLNILKKSLEQAPAPQAYDPPPVAVPVLPVPSIGPAAIAAVENVRALLKDIGLRDIVNFLIPDAMPKEHNDDDDEDDDDDEGHHHVTRDSEDESDSS
eukprot:GFYU01005608.1.p1 GENE.GFYU01005608.1~~GFYU01005608.1.p1  ORF type:complete len:181 (+),score=67.94 GFYU01005608.1:47-589(+)